MNELALFAGAGGGILGGHLLGWRTVCAVEWDPYPASVLVARQNDGILPPFPIWDDVQTFDGRPWAGIVDVVSGGFPCQDISAAGKGAGITGTRSSMWKHMARIIGEVRPQYVFVENSPMLTTRGLGVVLADLSTLGFDAKWGVVSAADVGANHKRERIWILANTKLHGFSATQDSRGAKKTTREQQARPINTFNIEGTSGVPTAKSNVAYTNGNRLEAQRPQFETTRVGGESEMADTSSTGSQGEQRQKQQGSRAGFADKGQDVTNTNVIGTQIPIAGGESSQQVFGGSSEAWGVGRGVWWHFEPNVGRVAHGVAARVDRLKAIGNGQVPEVARTAWGLLK